MSGYFQRDPVSIVVTTGGSQEDGPKKKKMVQFGLH